MHRPRLLPLVVIAIACSREAPEKPVGASSVRPDEIGMPEPLRVDVIERICKAAPCSGELARIEVWRSATGKIMRYAHHGDIQSCSHPPLVVFDADGKELGAIANQPVVPGSPEARAFDEKRTKLYGDSRKVETADCNGRVAKQ